MESSNTPLKYCDCATSQFTQDVDVNVFLNTIQLKVDDVRRTGGIPGFVHIVFSDSKVLELNNDK